MTKIYIPTIFLLIVFDEKFKNELVLQINAKVRRESHELAYIENILT